MLVVVALFLTSCETTNLAGGVLDVLRSGDRPLTLDTIAAGLKEALEVGTQNAADMTSKPGGFSKNPALFISVPEKLEKVTKAMRRVGLGSLVDNWEQKMNLAAEQASSQAASVFISAIKQMTFKDAKEILNGTDTAATDYFREKTQDQLRRLYAPIVHKHMESVGAVKVYNDLMGRYNAIPLVPKQNFDSEAYVTQGALDGLFKVLADEEKKIRQDPAARTTELLKRVFEKK
jgi:hypothetical protein